MRWIKEAKSYWEAMITKYGSIGTPGSPKYS
jgi:hypothetical protein